MESDFETKVHRVLNALAQMLIDKNRAYGNSALNPVRVFSKAEPVEQINVRLDDKLSRIARGLNAGEDAEWDMLGYLVLKRISQMNEQEHVECQVKNLSNN